MSVRHRQAAVLGGPEDRQPFINANGGGEDSLLLTKNALRSMISDEIRQSPRIRLICIAMLIITLLLASIAVIAMFLPVGGGLSQDAADLEARIFVLETLLMNITRVGKDLTFIGLNLHIVDGSGDTDGPVNDCGNVIIGYNEGASTGGSHNLVVGRAHDYASSYAGIVNGFRNTLSGVESAALGGMLNDARGERTAVIGGRSNVASGVDAAVMSGVANIAAGEASLVGGGTMNTASTLRATLVGGAQNQAPLGHCSGDFQPCTENVDCVVDVCILTGSGLTCSDADLNVGAGCSNDTDCDRLVTGDMAGDCHDSFCPIARITCTGSCPAQTCVLDQSVDTTIAGGIRNTVTNEQSTVTGGDHNSAVAGGSIVSGGSECVASGDLSGVYGGNINRASGLMAVTSGGQGGRSTGTLSGTFGGATGFFPFGGGPLASAFAATTVGGAYPDAKGDFSLAAGGEVNLASAFISVTIGGGRNRATEARTMAGAGFNNHAAKIGSTAFGGVNNVAGGGLGPSFDASTFGGAENIALGSATATTGGFGNEAGPGFAAWTGAGFDNKAKGKNSAIVGGLSNTAEADESVVVGGTDNTAGTTLTPHQPVVVGGTGNIANGPDSVVVGGTGNIVALADTGAVVLGGMAISSSGPLSIRPHDDTATHRTGLWA